MSLRDPFDLALETVEAAYRDGVDVTAEARDAGELRY